MHISILLMEQITELFLMIFMGFLIVKTGLLKDDDSKVLSKIVLYLLIPCVIINAFQVDYTMDTVKGLLIALAASVMLQIILLIIISAFGKLLHLNEVEIASVYYSNSGNLIVPIVTFILGQEWVLYGCAFMSVQLVSGCKSEKGKTVYPFATNGGWIGHTFEDFQSVCQGADVKKGMNIRFDETTLRTSKKDIEKWIDAIH